VSRLAASVIPAQAGIHAIDLLIDSGDRVSDCDWARSPDTVAEIIHPGSRLLAGMTCVSVRFHTGRSVAVDLSLGQARRMPESIFVAAGEGFMPTDFARGPWTPAAQHGGAPAALLARAVERFDGGGAMVVARLTIELLRPVPIAPLSVRTRMVRPGKKVQLVEASLTAADTEVARCTGLRMRRAELPLSRRIAEIEVPPGPMTGEPHLPAWDPMVSYTAFHRDGVEHRFVAGGFSELGPATDWIRLRVPLIAGEETSPLCRVAAAADFGNGISAALSRGDGYTFINPDLTIYLHRYPVSEWVCLQARTDVAPVGVGMAESLLFDERGSIGRSVQSLFIDRVATEKTTP
jgi:hypothetical protein